ncbi:ACP S-malonyltransferase [Bacillota bacterium]
MAGIAFVFSGQGAQYTGMGKELAECSKGAAEVFRSIDAIRPGTSGLCFEGSKEELQQTENTQPCIFAVGSAAAAALEEKGIKADSIAGFSAGEVAALAFGGYLNREDAFRYMIKRALYMKESGEKNPGTMFAVIGLSIDKINEICSKIEGRYPVNFNTENQVSVACTFEAAQGFGEAVTDAGGKAVKLAVSGGFHSPMMNSAREKLQAEFENMVFTKGSIPVYANVSAKPFEAREQMFAQINTPVLWYQTILNMAEDGIDTFVELGPGKTLCNMISKILPEATVLNVEDEKSLINTVEVLKNAQ